MRTRVRLSAEEERIAIALRRPDGLTIDMLVLAADALDAGRSDPVLDVGNGCQICAHGACPQRRETSVVEVMTHRPVHHGRS